MRPGDESTASLIVEGLGPVAPQDRELHGVVGLVRVERRVEIVEVRDARVVDADDDVAEREAAPRPRETAEPRLRPRRRPAGTCSTMTPSSPRRRSSFCGGSTPMPMPSCSARPVLMICGTIAR